MKFICHQVLLFTLILGSFSGLGQGFLHQDGQQIVDGNGNNYVLRGLGLGGWMLQEGYMLKTSAFAGPQFAIRQKITEVIGEEATEKWYQTYRDNGITKSDIDSLAHWGFNSIRLPMHYNLFTLPIEKEPIPGQQTWLEEGFQRTDQLLHWCAENKIYLILDLHGAPGGQGNDANISDYDTRNPALWQSQANADKMIALWKKLAQRYRNEPWIGGYDIINEPNWNFTGTHLNGCDETQNGPLRELMMRTTAAIRSVDKNHLIIIEGNCWGNNYEGIFPLWDTNMALSFHKYWNHNTVQSIQKMLDYRTQYNVPIWLGESGENSNVWFRDAIQLMESNTIGWAFWPMKKIENSACVTSVVSCPGYQKLLEYWKGNGTKPSKEEAQVALDQIVNNYRLENVTIRYDVIDALFRQIQSNSAIPFKKHRIPGIIEAEDYDLGPIHTAYFDNVAGNYWVSDNKRVDWNSGDSYRNDGVDISAVILNNQLEYAVTHTEPGEWLQYTVTVETSATYAFTISYTSEEKDAQLYLTDDKENRISPLINLKKTEDVKYWNLHYLTIPLKKGTQKIRLHFEKGNMNLNALNFQLSK
ncbi:MAG: hypothetical protein RL607_37 [Bacteroidota bacterium]